IAEVGEENGRPDPHVKVVEVLWAQDKADLELQSLQVTDLDRKAPGHGWKGPGRYLLPLEKKADSPEGTVYKLAPVGRSPGYPPPRNAMASSPGPDLIYPVTPETLRQEKEIRAGHWEK